MTKLFLFLALDIFFLVSGYAQKQNRVSVADYGAVPDSREDAVIPIIEAIKACKSNKASVLFFPKGRYDLYAKNAVQKEYFISNTSTAEECPSRIKTIGMLLEGMKNLTIEGNGSLLMFHGKMITFSFDHCENIILQNIAMDFERPTMSEFTILNSSADAVEVQVHPDSWYRLDSGKLSWYGEGWMGKNYHCIRMDTGKQTMYYANDLYRQLMQSKVKEVSPARLKFEGVFIPGAFPKGDMLSVRDPIRDQVGAFIAYSKNIHLKNVSMHYMHGLGIISQFTENIWMQNVFIEPRKESGRRISSFADGMHFSGCRGKILIEHCRFNGMHDDPINVHGTHLKIVQQNSPNELTVRFMHNQTSGMEAFFRNDSIAFVHPSTLLRSSYGVIKNVMRLSDTDILLTMKSDIPGSVKLGDVVENITWTPELTIRHCELKNSNTRGLLVTTRRKVRIENNLFYRLGMHSILIADDAASWFESGPVEDVLIRDNIFKECGYNSGPAGYVISIAPENHELTPYPVHRNIRIENNVFYCFDSPVLFARSVNGLSFVGNTVRKTDIFEPSSKPSENFYFKACKNVLFKNNMMDKELPGKNIRLEAMEKRELRLIGPQKFIWKKNLVEWN